MITKPLERLTDAPQFAEFRECELNGFDNSPIRMLNNLAGCILYIADRKPLEQLTAARFGFLPCLHTLPKNFQLDNTQCSFDTQHQLIIQITQIVNLLFVSDEGSKNLAHFNKPAPILVRTGQPRDFTANDDSHLA